MIDDKGTISHDEFLHRLYPKVFGLVYGLLSSPEGLPVSELHRQLEILKSGGNKDLQFMNFHYESSVYSYDASKLLAIFVEVGYARVRNDRIFLTEKGRAEGRNLSTQYKK